ncbi:MAG: chromosomal replication initiator protein DnaA [Treponema sp.]|nr:chromosomal replication initiator protein DnaA [Treponema sp.]
MAELDYEGFWKETLIQLRNDLGEEEFSGWFSDLKYLRAGNNSIVVGVPSKFHRDKVISSYQCAIITILKSISGEEINLEHEIIKQGPQKKETQPVKTSTAENPPAEKAPKPKEKRDRHSQLQENFTFENYVIGETNGMAGNAAIAVSRNPGKTYNPLLIFGGVGLGKTHLMQAIGNYVHENSDNKVIYTTSENFLNEFVQAIQDNKPNYFKNKFRYTDVLLIDDIQFFQNKDKIQEELFHTFNALFDSKKQLVFTCDRPVSELKTFSERIISRFGLGLIVDLQFPRYEERCAILKKEAESKNADIPFEVIDLISSNVSSNIRDLKFALNTLIAFTVLMKKPITLEIAQQQLKNIFNAPRQANLSMDKIIRVTAEYFSLTPNDLKGRKRTQNIVFARQLAMYIGKEMTEYSTTEIGQDFGGKDHTTVMYSIQKIKEKLLTDPTLELTIETIIRSIKEFSAKN